MNRKSMIKAAAIGLGWTAFSMLSTTVNAAETRPSIAGQDEKQDEKAVEVIEKSIEAMGGAEMLSKFDSAKQTGTISIPSAGLTGTLESYVKSPDMFLLVVDFPAMGKTKQGLNGDVAWTTDAMSGPRLMPEAEERELRREADMESRLKFKDEYPTIEYVSETQFDGQKAHKLRLVNKEGNESTEYYSVESHYMIGSERVVPSQMGPTNTVSYMRDYKELGGMLQPTTMVQKIGPTEIIITLKSAEYGEVDESVFELPDAVKALIEATEAEDETEQDDD